MVDGINNTKSSINNTKDNIADTVWNSVKDAEMVLVGIGEEFGIEAGSLEDSREYAVFMEMTGGQSRFQWMLPFVEEIFRKDNKDHRVTAAYDVLGKLLQEKNYFIISVRTDDFIYDTDLKKDRIVTPCGGYRFWQCPEGCGQRIFERDGRLADAIRNCLNGNGKIEKIEMPSCPVCGRQLIHNNIKVTNYVEEGYLETWNAYKKWLQGTVNHKLCVLELGVGMQYPGVIRWPFEKMVFFNQKSVLFRIHSKLYQLTEEIRERGYKIKEKPIDFLVNRFV